MKPTRAETKMLNDTLLEQLDNPGMDKAALDAINEYTRMKIRQASFSERFLPPLSISNDELDRQITTDRPAK